MPRATCVSVLPLYCSETRYKLALEGISQLVRTAIRYLEVLSNGQFIITHFLKYTRICETNLGNREGLFTFRFTRFKMVLAVFEFPLRLHLPLLSLYALIEPIGRNCHRLTL